MTESNSTTVLNNTEPDSVCDDVEDNAATANGVTNTNGNVQINATNDGLGQETPSKPVIAIRKLWLFMIALIVDAIVSVIVLAPIWPYLRKMENTKSFDHFTLYSSMTDLSFLAALRITSSLLAILICFCRAKLPPEEPRYDHFDKFHPNGDRKTREQLEQEALEEPFFPWLVRFLVRPSLSAEIFAVVAQTLCIVKCLVRMNVEIGIREDADAYHPVFWLAVLCTAVLSAIEVAYLEDVCKIAAQCGHERYGGPESEGSESSLGIFRSISSQLLAPLLENEHTSVDEEQDVVFEPGSSDNAPTTDENDDNVRATSDITGDPSYKAKWTDLLMMCYQDGCMIIAAFVFLLLAAIAQVLIPKYLGNILDALAEAFGKHDEANRHISMWDVPGFMTNVKLLVVASILAGVFAGLRGSIFTVVGARVNVRLRVKLMDALLSQDIGFFDITKTGDITSRLSSDTTLVGDQIAMNVNVFLRSTVQAAGVLFFMVLVSWQLTILAFISVPLITLLSTWYGSYVRALTKVMQQKLADGNSVSEAALGSMATVRAFDAAEKELSAFEDHMKKYLNMNLKSAIAYYGYATLSVAIPELIFAVVVFYGGMLVRNDAMTSGELVSFLLYLQSLSDAFSTIGWVFTSLTQAVGAADKVFELMHREPRITSPSQNTPQDNISRVGILGIEATKTRQQRLFGIRPERARGEIVLENVKMYYPARPNRCVLNGLSLKIEPGSIVALVGQSGGGKSSVMSLIQHLYEPSSGRVMFDGIDIHELSPEWLSRNVCIVSQEPTLFARSIKKNIMYGLEGTDDEPSDDEIIAAAQLANADSFIQNMPQKYDTEVGERGVQLSGGQKQRIAIARALVRKPKLLLLDEATSALDAESEHLVQQAIDDMLVRGKGDGGNSSMTVIIVAHRLSTVRSADRIYVIKEGQVVEEGSHDDLIVNPDGAYSALIKRQMQAQQSFDNTADVVS